MSHDGHNQVVIYCAAAESEVAVLDLDQQERLCREHVAEHDVEVVEVVAERLHQPDIPVPHRPRLLGTLRQVRALGARGVLLVVGPDRLGSVRDQAVVRRLVEDGSGCVATVGPGYLDRVTRFRVHEVMTAISLHAMAAEEIREAPGSEEK